jgi:hypothetical protein
MRRIFYLDLLSDEFLQGEGEEDGAHSPAHSQRAFVHEAFHEITVRWLSNMIRLSSHLLLPLFSTNRLLRTSQSRKPGPGPYSAPFAQSSSTTKACSFSKLSLCPLQSIRKTFG